MAKKRDRDSKGQGAPIKKKQRVDNVSNDAVVALDDLDWKAVALPDRLDDAEGFFGLEEIDGVDIVRPEGKGEIKFKVRIPRGWLYEKLGSILT